MVTTLASVLLNVFQEALGVPSVVIQIVQFGPALGLLSVLLLRLRRPEKRTAIHLSLSLGRGALGRALFAVGLYAVVLVVALAAYALLFDGEVSAADPAGFGYPFLLILVAQFIGAGAEEAGWRCYLQPELQGRFGVLPAAVVVGILWGAWHIHIFAQEPLAIAGFFLMTISSSVVLAVLLRRDRTGNLLISGLLHTLINLGLLFFMPQAIENGPQILSFAIPFTIAAVVVAVVGTRHR
ncbi:MULTISPECIES: CPBP family intramembrane glutamic endopeptidase [Nocardiopsidaceae]|uniref:CPBP family intramembrane metalloprotease n=1 Tax=Streptomonospora nanhaiensis TaxID=1323731 RepID=A0ABY6YUC6_9ACTN|nr:CPBP family intramembrane glutamic endopeptidase [Streptomonospora nanhaiensis]WAE75817.1 CPBP family intramembrane metalloprotease [Streptomonospora nanhaiensis]